MNDRFAHGKRRVEQDRRVHRNRFALAVAQRELPAGRVAQCRVGDEGQGGDVFRALEPRCPGRHA
jgi:hypothetical protein